MMRRALLEARTALERGDVPVGAVVTDEEGRILGLGANAKSLDPTAHAEIQALRRAGEARGHWNLSGCTLYVTLEPCPMCAGACVHARLRRVVFAAPDPRAGAVGSLYNLLRDPRLNHRCAVRGGVLEQESAQLLWSYFQRRRDRGRMEKRSGEQPC